MMDNPYSVYRVTTPLCPAGRLPHKEGDRLGAPARQYNSPFDASKRSRGTMVVPLVTSAAVGEMAGRPEGGILPPTRNQDIKGALHVPRS